MNNDLYLIIAAVVSCGLSMGIYLLATSKRRALIARFNALSNGVWQAKASLRTRDWEADNLEHLQGSNTRAKVFDLMQELTTLVEECVEHRDVARAWLLLGGMGNATVAERCNLGQAAIAKFNRKLRQYDRKSTN